MFPFATFYIFKHFLLKILKIRSQPKQEYTVKKKYQPLEAVPPEMFLWKDILKIWSKVAKPLYWNHTSA